MGFLDLIILVRLAYLMPTVRRAVAPSWVSPAIPSKSQVLPCGGSYGLIDGSKNGLTCSTFCNRGIGDIQFAQRVSSALHSLFGFPTKRASQNRRPEPLHCSPHIHKSFGRTSLSAGSSCFQVPCSRFGNYSPDSFSFTASTKRSKQKVGSFELERDLAALVVLFPCNRRLPTTQLQECLQDI